MNDLSIVKLIEAKLLSNQANQANQANQGRASDTIKSIVELIEAKLLSNQANQANKANKANKANQGRASDIIKLIVELIQAKLLSNQANQGRASDIIKSIVEDALNNEGYIYSAKEIRKLCNSNKQTWDRFVAEFLSKIDFTQKTDYLEEHPSRSGGNRYTEKTLKAFQEWLMRNQTNQDNSSDTIKSIVKSAVKNEFGIA